MFPRNLRKQPQNTETLERLKRWPKLRKKLAAKNVYILSDWYYWRPDAAGYTGLVEYAGIYMFEEAYRITKHCDPEKHITYKVAPPQPKSDCPYCGGEGVAGGIDNRICHCLK